MIKTRIIDYCKSIGLDTVGFIECREFNELKNFYKYRKENNLENEFEEEEIDKRINPKLYMEHGKTIISIAFPYKSHDTEYDNGFSTYTKRLDYHKVVKMYLEKICEYIKELGGEAISFVDSNTLPERYIAYLANVGFIGRNNMIITEKYGSFIFLGEIITDLELESDEVRVFEDISKYEKCGECNNCYSECPTKSINKNKINPNICTSYITQKKELGDKDFNLIKNKVFGCDICQNKCPYNKEIEISKISEFKILDYMNSDNTNTLAEMSNKYFKENILRTSCGWRGKNIIKRNAIIRLFNEGQDITKFKGESPSINELIDKLNDNI